MSLLEARGFTAEDFALSHPGGALGRKLLLTNETIMHKNDRLPVVNDTATVKEAVFEMSAKGLGMTGIIDESGTLVGIFTDGDLRRWMDKDEVSLSTPILDVMTVNSVVSKPTVLAAETLSLMEEKRISALFIVDDKARPLGALNMHDMLKAGVI